MSYRSFQARVFDWAVRCFGLAVADDRIERTHRFLEEALELAQACGCADSQAHQLVDYVYGRPTGAMSQEVGGVALTLHALCSAWGIDADVASEDELARAEANIAKIRAKQAAKPRYSPLPEVQ